jgi:hypothetical protein
MASKSSVSVSYDSVPTIQEWERIKPDVERHLPLNNLHWKSSSRTIRTIQSLALNFQPIASFDLQKPTNRLLDRPYLHLLFVSCDVSSCIILNDVMNYSLMSRSDLMNRITMFIEM